MWRAKIIDILKTHKWWLVCYYYKYCSHFSYTSQYVVRCKRSTVFIITGINSVATNIWVYVFYIQQISKHKNAILAMCILRMYNAICRKRISFCAISLSVYKHSVILHDSSITILLFLSIPFTVKHWQNEKGAGWTESGGSVVVKWRKAGVRVKRQVERMRLPLLAILFEKPTSSFFIFFLFFLFTLMTSG